MPGERVSEAAPREWGISQPAAAKRFVPAMAAEFTTPVIGYPIGARV